MLAIIGRRGQITGLLVWPWTGTLDLDITNPIRSKPQPSPAVVGGRLDPAGRAGAAVRARRPGPRAARAALGVCGGWRGGSGRTGAFSSRIPRRVLAAPGFAEVGAVLRAGIKDGEEGLEMLRALQAELEPAVALGMEALGRCAIEAAWEKYDSFYAPSSGYKWYAG